MIHGMGFGALYLMACSGALVELYRRYYSHSDAPVTTLDESVPAHLSRRHGRARLAHRAHRRLHHLSLVSRRAAAGIANLAAFPQRLLCRAPPPAPGTPSAWSGKSTSPGSRPSPSPWPPRSFSHYGRNLRIHPELRTAVLGFVWISLLAAGIAGFFGAMLNKNAPVEGGPTIHYRPGRTEMSAQTAAAFRRRC